MKDMPVTDVAPPAPGRTRRNRGSEVVRDALLDAAVAAFAAHGFEGASTRAIAEAAGAHQSQIKYHFDTKFELWKQCLERLLDEIDREIAAASTGDDGQLAALESTIRGIVRFSARRPELNRIMVHEATSASERLDWLVTTHLAPRHAATAAAWRDLSDSGVIAPVDVDVLWHTLIGAASLLYTNAPEARLLGIDTADPALVERHADALVAMFLPGAAPAQ